MKKNLIVMCVTMLTAMLLTGLRWFNLVIGRPASGHQSTEA